MSKEAQNKEFQIYDRHVLLKEFDNYVDALKFLLVQNPDENQIFYLDDRNQTLCIYDINLLEFGNITILTTKGEAKEHEQDMTYTPNGRL